MYSSTFNLILARFCEYFYHFCTSQTKILIRSDFAAFTVGFCEAPRPDPPILNKEQNAALTARENV